MTVVFPTPGATHKGDRMFGGLQEFLLNAEVPICTTPQLLQKRVLQLRIVFKLRSLRSARSAVQSASAR